MPPPAETPPLTPPSLASRFAHSWWPAPTLSLAIFLIALVLAFTGAVGAPYYIFKLWEASILLHAVVAVSLFIRGKNREGTISICLLCVPLGCFWLVA